MSTSSLVGSETVAGWVAAEVDGDDFAVVAADDEGASALTGVGVCDDAALELGVIDMLVDEAADATGCDSGAEVDEDDDDEGRGAGCALTSGGEGAAGDVEADMIPFVPERLLLSGRMPVGNCGGQDTVQSIGSMIDLVVYV